MVSPFHARVAAMLLGLLFLIFIHPVEAVALVRVALALKASEVQISSPSEVRLHTSSSTSSFWRVPLSVTSAAGGLQVNGMKVFSQKVIIRGDGQLLRFSVEGASSRKGRRGGMRNWVVKGDLEIQIRNSSLLVINRVKLEDYVAGVVASEINPNWHAEVLKTQAIAARTYVLHKQMMSRGQDFDVEAGIQDQVYTGVARVNGSVREAVAETLGLIITYEGRPIFAAYSSTAAGPTEDAMNVWEMDLPYLKGVDCPFDEESPRYEWRIQIEFATVERKLRGEGFGVGTLATVTPYTFTHAGRVKQVRVLHSKGELILSGQDFRRIMGYTTIPSTRFRVERIGREVVLSGKGAGHAVGLCQWGAKEMAELGYRYESILQYYYPMTNLMNRYDVNMTPAVQYLNP